MYLDAAHLVERRAAHEHRIVGPDWSAEFARHLDALPWNAVGTRLDWAQIPHVAVHLSDPSAEAVLETSALAELQWVFVLFAPAESGLICRRDDAVRDLDALFWKAPGYRYLCGVRDRQGTAALDLSAVAEYDQMDTLTVTR